MIGRSFSTVNLQGSTDARKYADARQTAVLRPSGAAGISGWVFDIPTGEQVELTAEITDHFTESNSFINDHVVKPPQRVTLSGFVGELLFVLAEARQQSLAAGEDGFTLPGSPQELQNSLSMVEAYLGDFTPGMVAKARQAVSLADMYVSLLNRTVNRVQNLVGVLNGTVGVPQLPPIPGTEPLTTTRQRGAYEQLKALWSTNQICTVQTPWEFFENMMIESIAVSQDEVTRSWTDFRVTLKEVRFAEVSRVQFNDDLFPPRVEIQGEDVVEVGRVETVEEDGLKSGFYRVVVEGLIEG